MDRKSLSDEDLLKLGPVDPKTVDDFLKDIPSGRIFTVKFIKEDGSVRKMVCRRGVKKYLKGGESTIKDRPNLVGVFDMQKMEYRCFNKTCVLDIG